MTIGTLGVGILGCGEISEAYLDTIASLKTVRLAGCADILPDLAKDRAARYGAASAYGPDELFADPDVDLVLNLTRAPTHASLSMVALSTGKSVFTEKPMAIRRDDGRALVESARTSNLGIGCAPGVFLGAGLQTARAIIDEGGIGTPQGAIALLLAPPQNDALLYMEGSGPLMDMGPYYISALIHILGPARRVSASVRMGEGERTIDRGPRAGEMVPVKVGTHASATIDFVSGVIVTFVISYEVAATTLMEGIEIYGTEGSLFVDPNQLEGPVRRRRLGQPEWEDVPLRTSYSDSDRWWGIAVAEMIQGMLRGTPHRASGEFGLHALDIMVAAYESSASSTIIDLTTTCERPASLPPGWNPEQID